VAAGSVLSVPEPGPLSLFAASLFGLVELSAETGVAISLIVASRYSITDDFIEIYDGRATVLRKKDC
jgi:hypothetical protein